MLKTVPQRVTEIRSRHRCVSIQEAMNELITNNGVMIDVRDGEEVAKVPVTQSIPISRGMLEVKMLNLYPQADQPIYLHCATGARATLAADQLSNLGYQKVVIITCDLKSICECQ